MKLSFIVVLHNRVDLARATVDSLRDTVDLHGHELLLIDNASTDETGEWLSTLSARVRSFRNEENLGFAAANNQGARAATGELLVLLNSDLILSHGWLEPMLEPFDRIPNPGVVGNVQLRVADSSVDHAGIVFRDGGYPRHWREDLPLAQAAGLREFPAVTAACCIAPRDWFLATGGFDEGYRNGFEDVDLCLRAREDGRVNLVAGTSVIRHHIGASAGRGTYEFRNAERFLARWGTRTRALETAWLRETAARETHRDAADYLSGLRTAPWKFRPALAAHHRRVVRTAQREASRRRAPLTVAVDLERMQPGGGHGGIKPATYGFLRALGELPAPRLRFAVFCRPELRDELAPLLRAGDGLATAPADTPRGVGAEVLWCPFGQSRFLGDGLPAVSWIVDALHRDLPAALPPEEVNFREGWMRRVVAHATFLQCNSRHVQGRLQELYGVDPARCFHAYQPVQERLAQASEDAARPEGFPRGPYFLYPANFWPHKNHETLLLAYRQYRRAAGEEPWNLVFTGHPDAREQRLREMADALGIAAGVHFAGHVRDDEFAAIWRRAGALVFPSLHEGFGIPPLEAMRFGVPVLASRATSLPEIGGDACLWLDPLDAGAMAAAMARITTDDGLREELIARGRRRVHEFNLGVEAARLAHFLLCAARGYVP